jgi:CRP-like cAMP-binding protein
MKNSSNQGVNDLLTAPDVLPCLFDASCAPQNWPAEHGKKTDPEGEENYVVMPPFVSFNPHQEVLYKELEQWSPGDIVGVNRSLLGRNWKRSIRAWTTCRGYIIKADDWLEYLSTVPMRVQADMVIQCKVVAKELLAKESRPSVEELQSCNFLIRQWPRVAVVDLVSGLLPFVARKGERICHDVFTTDLVYVLHSGKVALTSVSTGKTVRTESERGCTIGLQALIAHEVPAQFGDEVAASALEYAELWTISVKELEFIVNHHHVKSSSVALATTRLRSKPPICPVSVIIRAPLLSSLPDAVLSNICKGMTAQVFTSGEIVLREQSKPDFGIVLLLGKVINCSLKKKEDQGGTPRRELGVGATFGFPELLANVPLESSIVCVGSVVALTIRRSELLDIVSNNQRDFSAAISIVSKAEVITGAKKSPVAEEESRLQATLAKSLLRAAELERVAQSRERAAKRAKEYEALQRKRQDEEAQASGVNHPDREKREREAMRRKLHESLTEMLLENRVFASINTQLFAYVHNKEASAKAQFFANPLAHPLPLFRTHPEGTHVGQSPQVETVVPTTHRENTCIAIGPDGVLYVDENASRLEKSVRKEQYAQSRRSIEYKRLPAAAPLLQTVGTHAGNYHNRSEDRQKQISSQLADEISKSSHPQIVDNRGGHAAPTNYVLEELPEVVPMSSSLQEPGAKSQVHSRKFHRNPRDRAFLTSMGRSLCKKDLVPNDAATRQVRHAPGLVGGDPIPAILPALVPARVDEQGIEDQLSFYVSSREAKRTMMRMNALKQRIDCVQHDPLETFGYLRKVWMRPCRSPSPPPVSDASAPSSSAEVKIPHLPMTSTINYVRFPFKNMQMAMVRDEALPSSVLRDGYLRKGRLLPSGCHGMNPEGAPDLCVNTEPLINIDALLEEEDDALAALEERPLHIAHPPGTGRGQNELVK